MFFRDKKPEDRREEPVQSELIQRFKARPFIFVGTVVVLAIVIVAFVFVPAIVPKSQSGSELIFGYYNKTPIKYVSGNYFHRVQYALTQQQRSSHDEQNIGKMLEIWNQAFNETVIYYAMLDEMKEAGYKTPESVVDREVAALPDFQENGRFSAAKYRAMDNNSRLSLWRQTQENITANIYRSDFENLKVSSKEIPFIISMASPARSFDAAVFPMSDYPDSEINSFVAENKDLFMVTRLSKITIASSEREARKVLESVKSGVSTFEEMARSNSQDMYADKGGDMGSMMAFELKYEIADDESRNKIINLGRDELSGIIKVTSGWAFFRAEEASYPADINDLAQKAKIRTYIMQNERGRAEDWLEGEAKKFIDRAEKTSFNTALSEMGVARRSFGPISINYGDALPFDSLALSAVTELESARSNKSFWKLAFSTPVNTVSKPLVLNNHIIVLLPLQESKSEKIDEYTETFNTYWPYWMTNITSATVRTRFLESKKLVDKFQETFMSLWAF